MTIDERLQAVTMNLELMSRESETQRENIEALQGATDALRLNTEILLETARQDGENIRALARIAEIHERRLTDLEQQ